MDTFGQYLRELRVRKNIQQLELSERTGVKTTYLSKIENDKVPPPSEDVLLRLADALQVNPYQFILQAGKIPTEFQKIILSNHEIYLMLERLALQKKHA